MSCRQHVYETERKGIEDGWHRTGSFISILGRSVGITIPFCTDELAYSCMLFLIVKENSNWIKKKKLKGKKILIHLLSNNYNFFFSDSTVIKIVVCYYCTSKSMSPKFAAGRLPRQGEVSSQGKQKQGSLQPATSQSFYSAVTLHDIWC